jgi:hypothetical protein
MTIAIRQRPARQRIRKTLTISHQHRAIRPRQRTPRQLTHILNDRRGSVVAIYPRNPGHRICAHTIPPGGLGDLDTHTVRHRGGPTNDQHIRRRHPTHTNCIDDHRRQARSARQQNRRTTRTTTTIEIPRQPRRSETIRERLTRHHDHTIQPRQRPTTHLLSHQHRRLIPIRTPDPHRHRRRHRQRTVIRLDNRRCHKIITIISSDRHRPQRTEPQTDQQPRHRQHTPAPLPVTTKHSLNLAGSMPPTNSRNIASGPGPTIPDPRIPPSRAATP